jgi:hypothetical protein
MLANGCFGGVALAWVLLWSLVTLVFDGAIGLSLAWQVRAATFPTTDGTITRSEVRSKLEGGSETHQLDVAYDYVVDGKPYTGTRYFYAATGTDTNTMAWHDVRDRLPVGSRVSVAYDPDDPADALLHPGLTGFHLAMVWFLMPFNIVMVGGWVRLARPGRPTFDRTDPRTVVPTATGCRARLPGSGPAAAFTFTLLAVTFCGVFVWGLGFGFNPPVPVVVGASLGAVALAVRVAAWHPWRWLEVDDVARVVRLPARPEPVEVPFDAIRDVVVTHEEVKDSDGDVCHSYHSDLVRTDGPPVRVATHWDTVWPTTFVAWLRERVGIAPASDEEQRG